MWILAWPTQRIPFPFSRSKFWILTPEFKPVHNWKLPQNQHHCLFMEFCDSTQISNMSVLSVLWCWGVYSHGAHSYIVHYCQGLFERPERMSRKWKITSFESWRVFHSPILNRECAGHFHANSQNGIFFLKNATVDLSFLFSTFLTHALPCLTQHRLMDGIRTQKGDTPYV